MIKFVVQAYGRTDIIEQSLVSIVSLLRWLPAETSHRIEVFTDQGPRLEKFFVGLNQVKVIPFTPDEMRAWRGPLDFVHRAKIEILKRASNDPKVSGLVYLDGDTLIVQDPQPLISMVEGGGLLMHLEESRLAEPPDPLTRKIARFVRGKVWKIRGRELQIPPSTAMWNAGVIGVPARHFDVWDEILELTDQLYGGYQKHVMEQLAVSFCLQQRGPVRASDETVLHYWPRKEVFQEQIQLFLAQFPTAAAGLQGVASWRWPSLEKPQRPRSKFGLARWIPWVSG